MARYNRAMTAQPAPTPETPAPETIEVESRRIACDGGPLGHPRVWLSIGEEGFVECGYCDRKYVLKAGAGHHGH